jgi:hypothetical protein
MVRLTVLLSVGLIAGIASSGSATAQSSSSVVLGSKLFYAPGSEGFGTVAPARIYNGGVPSGEVDNITWQDWGQPVATGQGLTWIYRPVGGYYDQQGAIQLRAQGIGHCRNRKGKKIKQLAYRRLFASVVDYPGGPFGKWFRWSGAKSICNVKF